MNGAQPSHPASRAILLGVVLLVTATLWLASAVLIPFALALLLAFLLAPLVKLVQLTGLGRVPAVIIVVAFSFGVIGALGWLVTRQVADLASKLPDYRENIVAKARAIRSSVGPVDRATQTVEELSKAISATTQASQPASQPATAAAAPAGSQPTAAAPASEAPPGPPAPGPRGHPGAAGLPPDGTAGGEPINVRIVGREQGLVELLRLTLGPLLGPLGNAAIVIVWVIFMLVQREDLRDRLIRLVGHGRVSLTTEALTEAAARVSRYLIAQSMVNGLHGLVVGVGLYLIGLPNALLFALISAVLRFIPYVGPWIGAALPITLAVAVFDDWTRTVLVLGLFIVEELISNNVLEPWFYGSRVGASPMAILVSAVFWTWLWGPVGLVLATPLTVCLVVIGKYVPQLEFLTVLLGDQPALPPHVHFYQRLVAMDELESAEVVDESIESMSLTEFYDEIVIPALAQMERDRHDGVLSEERAEFIHQAVRGIIDELRERFGLPELAETAPEPRGTAGGDAVGKPPPGAKSAPAVPCTLCVPARDVADELIARMLGQVLELEGHHVRVLTHHTLASELITAVRQESADVVCVSALPPSTLVQARYVCKRLHREYADLPIVVGLWTSRLKPEVAVKRIGCGEQITVVSQLAQAALAAPRRMTVPVTAPPATPVAAK